MTAIVATATAKIRNFFYINPNVPTSISDAYITATSANGKTTFSYTNRRGEAIAISAEKFQGFWSGTSTGGKGYFSETPESRKAMFGANGERVAPVRVKGEARKGDDRAPSLPKF